MNNYDFDVIMSSEVDVDVYSDDRPKKFKTYCNGDKDSEVVLYTVKDGGHEWFGSPYFPDRNISINNLIWEFFEQHPKQ